MSDTERSILMQYGREWNVDVKNAFMAPEGPLPPAPEAPPGLRRTTRPHVLNYDFSAEKKRDSQVNAKRDEIISQVNDCLVQWQSPVRVRAGTFQSYEIYVYCRGVKGDYLALAEVMANRSSAERRPARKLLEWSQGPLSLHNLDDHLAMFAVIVYFAEVGRGYSHEVGVFEDWIRETVQSQTASEESASWQQFPTRYSFALIAAEDRGQDLEAS